MEMIQLWPLLLYFGVVVVLIAGMILVSWVLGQKHRERATGVPYESGMAPAGPVNVRFPVAFYLVGMFFLIFDVESVFLFSWAVAMRELGWFGYAEASLFIGLLIAALAWLWRSGGLEWRSP